MNSQTLAAATAIGAIALVAVGAHMLVKSSEESPKSTQLMAILEDGKHLVPVSYRADSEALEAFSAYDERVKNPVTIVVPSRKSSSEFAYLPLERRRKRKSRKARKNVA
jgi:hypothetical protein